MPEQEEQDQIHQETMKAPEVVSAPPTAYALFMKSLKDNEEF